MNTAHHRAAAVVGRTAVAAAVHRVAGADHKEADPGAAGRKAVVQAEAGRTGVGHMAAVGAVHTGVGHTAAVGAVHTVAEAGRKGADPEAVAPEAAGRKEADLEAVVHKGAVTLYSLLFKFHILSYGTSSKTYNGSWLITYYKALPHYTKLTGSGKY